MRRRRFAQPFQEGFEIKAGAAAQDRNTTPPPDVRASLARQSGESPRIERLAHLDHINQMMRHALPFVRRWFGGADVESAIDLHGIDGNDLAVEPLGQRQRHRGLAHGSRAGDEDWT